MANRNRLKANALEAVIKAAFGFIAFGVLAFQMPAFRSAIWDGVKGVLLPVVIVGGTLAVVWLLYRSLWPKPDTSPSGWVEMPPLATSPEPRPVQPAPAAKQTLPELLRQIDWFQFEKLVGALYRARGYSVTRRGGAQPDGGVDLLASKDGLTTVVQCKHWQSYLVKPDKVREVIGAQAIEAADGAAVVTLRGFTEAARKLAKEQSVDLVEESQLLGWLEELRFTSAWPEISKALNADDKRCPRCESALVRRTAEKGVHSGNQFWGCSAYPRCKFILPMGDRSA